MSETLTLDDRIARLRKHCKIGNVIWATETVKLFDEALALIADLQRERGWAIECEEGAMSELDQTKAALAVAEAALERLPHDSGGFGCGVFRETVCTCWKDATLAEIAKWKGGA